MEFKVSALAKLTMPMLVAAVLAGCGGDSNSGNSTEDNLPGDNNPTIPENPVDDLYKAKADEVVIYYKRDTATTRSLSSEGDYDGWGLHLWNGEGCTSTNLEGMGIPGTGTDWGSPYLATGFNQTYGAYYVLKVDTEASDPHECMNFILHKGDEKAFGSSNLKVQLRELGETRSLFGFHGSSELYYEPISDRPVAIDGQKGHWLDEDTIAWEAAANAAKVELRYTTTPGSIMLDEETKEISGGTVVELTLEGQVSDDSNLSDTFPHLSGLATTSIDVDESILKSILKSQIVLVAYSANGEVISATEVQKPGVLDAIYVDADAGNAIDADLGALVQGSDASFNLWAPTAKNVKLYIYDADKVQVGSAIQLTENTTTGIWSSEVLSDVLDKFYKYEVTVYHPTTGKMETVMVTDPYSLSLSANSLYSQVVDLENDTDIMPDGWAEYDRPSLDHDAQHVLYESHLRDFSFSDSSGSPALNGKYLALTENTRESVQHLQDLKDAGLTTLHILPAFDIATVDEVNNVNINDTIGDLCVASPSAAVCGTEDSNATIESVLESYDPATKQAQSLMNDLRMLDSFNWGYDPFHYTVPEGSYATDADGKARIKEFREMVKATHDMGLKLIMDVVYNHTNASGTNDKSVLDKIVPGYYHRLNVNTGGVENSTCCDNTATENKMMGKLMIDSLVVWAKQYNVDGFRFDLMAHQPKDLMVEALETVRTEADPETLFYGEGWDFGEVANNARFEQATQINMAGTEIGTFSDRLRDAVRGGSPFDGDGTGLRKNQGFANAAYLNERRDGSEEESNNMLHNQDIVRLGMAGNLADFVMVDYEGNTISGKDLDYNGAPAGYTKQPSENISYVSKHDNQTLWDNNAYKAATGIDSAERARMQSVALSTVMMGQGIPFIHMGSELLRSKSMQRDSYDSGDWFNRVKFDGSDNNWNVGLPREDKDGANYELIGQLLADTTLMPDTTDISLTKDQFLELLTIRSSSELFTLETADDVKSRVDFHNTGEDQIEGLIVMSIDDGTSAGADLDANLDAVVVVVNATADAQDFSIEGTTGFELHSVQQSSVDSIVRGASFVDSTFSVPALTTAVFVLPQDGGQGAGLPVESKEDVPPFGLDTVYIAGDFPADFWNPAGIEVPYAGNGKYKVTLGLASDTGYKFTLGSWDTEMGCDGGNCPANFTELGMYEFSIDATDYQAPVIAEAKLVESYVDKDWYIPGTIAGGWNHDATTLMSFDLEEDGVVYIQSADLTAGQTYEFKFTCGDWGACEHDANSVSATDDSLAIGGDNNITFTPEANGYYYIGFDFLEKKVFIEAL